MRLCGALWRDKDDKGFMKVSKAQRQQFISKNCICSFAGLWVVLIVSAFIIHWRAGRRHDADVRDIANANNKSLMAELRSPMVFQARLNTRRAFGQANHSRPGDLMAEDAAQLHEQCNPSLAPSELSSVNIDNLFASEKCGQQQANELRAALDAAKYSYEAIIPIPFMPPQMIESIFRQFAHKQLVGTIMHLSNFLNTKMEHNKELAFLVQFFAWGWPVHSQDLRAALGKPAVEALQQCGFVMSCSKAPSFWVSSAMLYPDHHSNSMFVTDWGVRYHVDKSPQPVPPVSSASMRLRHSISSTKGKFVRDETATGGLQAILAIKNGATRSEVVEANQRSSRVAQFNVWLNNVGSQVSILKPDSADIPAIKYDVLLAQHQAIENVMENGKRLLKPGGIFAVAMEIGDPKALAKELCEKKVFNHYLGTVMHAVQQSSKSMEDDENMGIIFGHKSEEHPCRFLSMGF